MITRRKARDSEVKKKKVEEVQRRWAVEKMKKRRSRRR
jgi:hypothetical protein